MADFEEFVQTVHNENTRVRLDNLELHGVPLTAYPVMVMDPDGDLLHVKDLTFDADNSCWIISVEN